MAQEKIIFETNLAETVALAFPRGKESPSQYTDQKTGEPIMEWYYSTTDDRCFYARAGLHEKIVALAPAVGEAFTITKKEVKQRGKKAFAEWHVARLEQSVSRPTAPVATTQTQTPLQNASGAGGAVSPQRNTSTTPIDQGKQYGATLRNTMPEPPPPDHRTAPPARIPINRALTDFLVMAGRATRESETILGAEGGSVRFDSRDVCALATSVLIEHFRQGRIALADATPQTSQPATPAHTAAAGAPKPAASATTAIPIPWNTRGEMKRSFLDMRPGLGAERYLAELERFGVSAPENFASKDVAEACYRRMVELLREVA